MYEWKVKIRKRSDMIDYLRKEINELNKISYRLKQRKNAI